MFTCLKKKKSIFIDEEKLDQNTIIMKQIQIII